MTLVVHREEDPRSGARPTGTFALAIVNNMPDGALAHTRRQFVSLLEAAVAPRVVEVHEYSMPGIPRSRDASEYLATTAEPLATLFASRVDAVVVTGAEPLADRLVDEPYWDDLVRVLEWSLEESPSLVLSCLAAHAALLALDGIDRRRLPTKLAGVFAQSVDISRPLLAGLPDEVPLPHSRLNDVPAERVTSAGYDVLVSSPQTGWTVANRAIGSCDVLLLQGHPEYDGSSLLREYRRDVARYLAGSRVEPPVLPTACVAPEDGRRLDTFHRSLLEGRLGPDPDAGLGFEELATRAPQPWRRFAVDVLAGFVGRSSNKRASGARARRHSGARSSRQRRSAS